MGKGRNRAAACSPLPALSLRNFSNCVRSVVNACYMYSTIHLPLSFSSVYGCVEVHNKLCCGGRRTVHVHSLHTSFGMADQTQKPRQFVSRNEKLGDDDDNIAVVIIVMVFAKTAGIRECRTGGLFVKQLNSVRGRTFSRAILCPLRWVD